MRQPPILIESTIVEGGLNTWTFNRTIVVNQRYIFGSTVLAQVRERCRFALFPRRIFGAFTRILHITIIGDALSLP